LPARLADLMQREERYIMAKNDISEIKAQTRAFARRNVSIQAS
jgi:hypothetical protein